MNQSLKLNQCLKSIYQFTSARKDQDSVFSEVAQAIENIKNNPSKNKIQAKIFSQFPILAQAFYNFFAVSKPLPQLYDFNIREFPNSFQSIQSNQPSSPTLTLQANQETGQTEICGIIIIPEFSEINNNQIAQQANANLTALDQWIKYQYPQLQKLGEITSLVLQPFFTNLPNQITDSKLKEQYANFCNMLIQIAKVKTEIANNLPSETYIVETGDSLWEIAEEYYGDGNQWTKIYEANQGVIGNDPDLINPSQELVIPDINDVSGC